MPAFRKAGGKAGDPKDNRPPEPGSTVKPADSTVRVSRGSAAYFGHCAWMNALCCSPRSRAAGVTIVFSPITILRFCFTACRTSSSQTKSVGGCAEGASGAKRPTGATGAVLRVLGAKGAGATGPGAEGAGAEGASALPRYPRDVRNASILRARTSAAIPPGAGGAAGGRGNVGAPISRFPDSPIPRFPDFHVRFAGSVS